jgi:hypothetical protein
MIEARMWHRVAVPDDDTLTEESRRTGTRDRSPLTWTVAGVVLLLIVGAVVFGLLTRGSDEADAPSDDAPDTDPRSVTELVAAPPTQRCMLPNAEVLRGQEIAFDGEVDSVAAGEATLVPSRFYAGDPTDLVVVKAPDGDVQALLAAVDFREGERYLVSASDGSVTVCGHSGPYTEDLAALYAEAFGG